MRNSFTVPMLPHLEKYVRKQFFDNQPGPYKLEEDTTLGKIVMSLLIDARDINMRGDNKIEMSASVKLQLSNAMAQRSPTIGKLVRINFFLHKLFQDDLLVWIKSAGHYGIKPFPASKDYLVHLGIEEGEYSHDAAYGHYKRTQHSDYRKKVLQRATFQNKTTQRPIVAR